jgi:hypothetical protein
MPFTYSITAGIGAGFVVYVLLKVVRGKPSVVHPLMWAISPVRFPLPDRPDQERARHRLRLAGEGRNRDGQPLLLPGCLVLLGIRLTLE